MAFLHGKMAIPLTLTDLATVTVADGKDVLTVPFDGFIQDVHMKLGNGGTTSGNTDITVAYTKPTDGYSTTGELWVAAAGVGRIAHDAVQYTEWDRDDLALYFIERGGTLSLNVDVIPGGSDSADLELTLWVCPLDKE